MLVEVVEALTEDDIVIHVVDQRTDLTRVAEGPSLEAQLLLLADDWLGWLRLGMSDAMLEGELNG